MVVYAKSSPPEDLKTHTEQLLKELESFKELYGERLERCIPQNFIEHFWKALELVIKYHDIGKLHTPFQNRIRKKLGLLLIQPEFREEVPHNLLSPAFLSEVDLQPFPKEFHPVLYQAIAYHHDKDREREIIENPTRWDEIKKIIEDDLTPNLLYLSDMQAIVPIPNKLKWAYRKKIERRIKASDGEVYKLYILLKGLLHRIDHAASAHLSVEEKPLGDSQDFVIPYLIHKGVKKECIWQTDAVPYRTNNIVMTASTGIGKTEFAYLWLGKDKGFYTLPVRTSVNAMFERTKETYRNNEFVGLLHSDSSFYQLEGALEKMAERNDSNSEGLSQSLHLIDISRQFAMPVTISTADQLFTATFKYKGYEKVYATLSYSKVIIDEIQSYDAEIVAVILRGLREIVSLGGKFCLMTATLPPLYKEYLEKIPNTILLEKTLHDIKHKIKLVNDDIAENAGQIIDAYLKHGKVLVIVNTVKKAQQVFEAIKKYIDNKRLNIPTHLLHSAFTYQSRRKKEGDILDKNCTGIWITTQLVEASLNIDFPILFSELATIDALIQRMGRILRDSKGKIDEPFIYKGTLPNVHIFENASGIGYIYDKDIVNASLEELQPFNGKLFSEEDKQFVVKKIFSRENPNGTQYIKRFDTSIRLLENGLEADNKRDAQELFRKISNMTVIPVNVYETFSKEIDEAINLLDKTDIKRTDRIKALYTIRRHSLSIPAYKAKDGISHLRKDMFLCTYEYSPTMGLIPGKNIENSL